MIFKKFVLDNVSSDALIAVGGSGSCGHVALTEKSTLRSGTNRTMHKIATGFVALIWANTLVMGVIYGLFYYNDVASYVPTSA